MKQRINYFRLFSFLRSFVMSSTMLRVLPRKSRGMGGNTGAFWVCFSSPNTQHLQHFLNIVVIQEEPEFHLIHHPSLHMLPNLTPPHTYPPTHIPLSFADYQLQICQSGRHLPQASENLLEIFRNG